MGARINPRDQVTVGLIARISAAGYWGAKLETSALSRRKMRTLSGSLPRSGLNKSAQGKAESAVSGRSVALGSVMNQRLALKGQNSGLPGRHALFRPFRASLFCSPHPRAALRGYHRFALPWADLSQPLRGEVLIRSTASTPPDISS